MHHVQAAELFDPAIHTQNIEQSYKGRRSWCTRSSRFRCATVRASPHGSGIDDLPVLTLSPRNVLLSMSNTNNKRARCKWSPAKVKTISKRESHTGTIYLSLVQKAGIKVRPNIRASSHRKFGQEPRPACARNHTGMITWAVESHTCMQ
eukprot:1145002-Pelagomonas_calceolata.AAC.2